MKRIITVISIVSSAWAAAQIAPPPIQRSAPTSRGPVIHSRKGTLIEKKVTSIGKFKNLNIQKIATKDASDNSTETFLGMMYEYETFDEISRKTLTVDKNELGKLVQALQSVEQKENEKANQETKYKFVTMSNIEFGSVYREKLSSWVHYIKIPSPYLNQNLLEFNKDELKELIGLLKKAEQEL
ncbi:hypothetical protein [Chryseobacterium aureum]|uniref:hypothetical protein n=1 Tax=Chryseobacterium aureum TaxID=2497456 RepID=UPI000F89988A|nr:hypothetical protein [Chryseobacterium aureum]